MKTYLVTASLLDAFAWSQDAPASWKDRARAGLEDTLRRIWRDNPAVKRGQDFEKALCSAFSGTREALVENFGEACGIFYDKCRYGKQQARIKKTVQVGGREYLLFGFADVLFPEHVYDIKTTGNWTGDDSYRKKSQHAMYCGVSGITNFTYLVACFDTEASIIPDFVKEIPILRLNQVACLDAIKQRILSFEAFLKNEPGLERDYREIFTKSW